MNNLEAIFQTLRLNIDIQLQVDLNLQVKMLQALSLEPKNHSKKLITLLVEVSV